MILQSAELTPSQKAAIESSIGRTLEARENVVVCGTKAHVASNDLRQAATSQMCQRLNRLDRAQRRMSIEEITAEILERSPADLPD
jgi:threonine aldolase